MLSIPRLNRTSRWSSIYCHPCSAYRNPEGAILRDHCNNNTKYLSPSVSGRSMYCYVRMWSSLKVDVNLIQYYVIFNKIVVCGIIQHTLSRWQNRKSIPRGDMCSSTKAEYENQKRNCHSVYTTDDIWHTYYSHAGHDWIPTDFVESLILNAHDIPPHLRWIHRCCLYRHHGDNCYSQWR